MYTTKKIAVTRKAFTLVEMLVVIAIILALAALAAAFAPRVTDNQKMTRAVDLLEQWLLTAKMRAKRDGLATGLRFIQAPGDAAGTYSQFQYIQQPEPLTGGFTSANLLGPNLVSAGAGMVTFANVDFSLGGLLPLDTFGRQQWLVQTGDYLEINGGGVFSIWGVVVPSGGQPPQLVLGGLLAPPTASGTSPDTTFTFTNKWTPLVQTTVVGPGGVTVFAAGGATANGSFLWQSQYEQSLTIGTPTTNYRIIRQPRILIGEEPLTLPTNYAANFGPIPGSSSTLPGTNVVLGPSGNPEILFSPTGAVVGTNAANSTVVISVWDTTMDIPDPNRVGIVGIQSRSGFIGAYDVSLSGNPFYFVQTARESGM
jgi:prepilin-type N-terminal cleavage/methylation domain-containing protein